MTNREFIETTTKSLHELKNACDIVEIYTDFAKHKSNIPYNVEKVLSLFSTPDSLQFAIESIRKNFIYNYKDVLMRYFVKFQKRQFDYLDIDATYVCDIDKIAIVNGGYNGFYIADIVNPDTYWNGILSTEARIGFPHYDYPELAMIAYYSKRDPSWLDIEVILR